MILNYMQPVRELEAWSMPGKLLDVDYSKDVLQPDLWKQGIPEDVFLGISAIPDATDCENLRLSIQSGELTENEFKDFCLKNNLPINLQSTESAAKFLEYMQGRCLAWIHLPVEDASSLLVAIVKMLKNWGHIVVDPTTQMPIA